MTSFLTALGISASVAWWSFAALIGPEGARRLIRKHRTGRAARAFIPQAPASSRAGVHRRVPAGLRKAP